MITRMRPLHVLLCALVALVALALSAAAFASDTPSPTAVAACQAEYAQVGADAFKAKYGATEPFGHCYAAHAPAVTTTTTTTTTSRDDPTTAACKAEYLKLGADAFKAKYGATEAFGNCLKGFSAPKTQPKPTDSDSPAVAACKAEYLKIGGSAFNAKYGASDPLSACVKAQAPAKSSDSDSPAVAACKAEYLKIGADAFKAKYGASETLGNCVKAQAPPKSSGSNGNDGAASVASAFCSAQGKALGTTVFLAKYGPKEAMGNCVKAALAKAKALVASCKESSGSSKDAFKGCIAAGVQPRRR
jgi:hypothetical protein